MLKIRVIPTLLWKEIGLVKGESFNSWRRVGPALPAIKVYNRRDVDELIFLDIAAHTSNNGPDDQAVLDYAKHCFVPFTVGGGIFELEHVQKLLRAGADKISINTSAYSNPNLIDIVAKRHGSQCVVASIDVRKEGDATWSCYSHSGSYRTGKEIVSWSKELVARGVGEILLTSIDRDGTMQGYDLALIEKVSQSVDVPVIASGGAGNYSHMIDAVKNAGASAVAAASMFHFTEQTPAQAKIALSAEGIPTRKNF